MKHSCRSLRAGTRFRLLLLMGLLVPLSCQQSGVHRLDQAQRAYETGQYQAAMDHAEAARFSGSVNDRAQASYIAGVAAVKLNQTATARHLLESAAASGDRSIAGRANVSLATVLLEDGEPLQAAHAFDRAADQLSGADATRATFQAALAYRDAGYAEQARVRFASAAQESSNDLADRASHEIDNTGFAIQGGAYSNRENALARAQELSAASRGTGLPAARIVQSMRAGRQLNIVQLGSFSTRTDAEFARRQLGVTGTRVEPVAIADAHGP